jgi:hypothetical protein
LIAFEISLALDVEVFWKRLNISTSYPYFEDSSQISAENQAFGPIAAPISICG